MRALAIQDSQDRGIQNLARDLGSAAEVEYWMRSIWRVLPDPPHAEYIRAPRFQLSCGRMEGDCDDATTFAAALLYALQIPSEMVAIRTFTDMEFSHVFLRSGPIVIDPIVAAHAIPLRYAEEMVMPV